MMSCKHYNRPQAKFCRFCGVELGQIQHPDSSPAKIPNPFGEIKASENSILHFEVSKRLNTFITTQKIRRQHKKFGLNISVTMPMLLFTGETGTGKSFTAQRFIENLRKTDCLTGNRIICTTLRKMQIANQSEIDVTNYLKEQNPDVLFIDEIQQDTHYLYSLLTGLSENRADTIIILAGIKKTVDEFFRNNSELIDLVDIFDFPSFTDEELSVILKEKLIEAGFIFNKDVENSLQECISVVRNDKNCIYQNGWIVEKEILLKLLEKQAIRLSQMQSISENDLKTIIVEDLPVEIKVQSPEEILSNLNELIGMKTVKNQVRQLCQTIINNQKRIELGLPAVNPKVHIVLTGNPGTGKTTVSRLLAKLFKAMKLLPSDKIVEIDGLGLTAGYLGQTKDKVNELCDKASGGILFIDEAYYLEQGGGEYSKEAVGTLLTRMENDRGRFIVIAAGYEKEMERFLKMNPGLASRFGIKINIDDYSADELCQIFELQVKKSGFCIEENALQSVVRTIDFMCKNKNKDFANAREIRNFFDKVKLNMDSRISELPEELLTKEVLSTICKEDIPQTENIMLSVEEVFSELNNLVGMENIKHAIKEIYDTVKINIELEKAGQKVNFQEIHFAITGNPGTGKTTVARLLGKLFYSMGLLTTDKVIETDRSKLVAKYVGHTAKNVQNYCDDAFGGILFIDEVYTLSKDDFGIEASDTLMKRMEDDRGKFIVVVAGYENKMQEWMQTNQGLSSRFTHYLNIPDYNTQELFEIFMLYVKQNNLFLSEGAVTAAKRAIAKISANRADDFANGRTVRQFFDSVIRRKNSRIIKLDALQRTKEVLTTLIEDDFFEAYV